MENSKAGSNEAHSTTVTTNEENGSNNNFNPSATTSTVSLDGGAGESYAAAVVNQIESDNNNNNNNNENRERRTPFTNLSQVEADLALARTLQEQERAFMMLRMSDNGGAYVSWEAGSYVPGNDYDFDDHSEYDTSDADDHYDDEEDAFDVHDHAEDGDDAEDIDDDDDDDNDDEEEEEENPGVELDPANFPSDEAYARALQDAEDQEMSSISLSQSGINEREVEEAEDHSRNSQDTWEEVDHNELSYEELLALGDLVGTASRGLSTDTISSLPSISYKTQSCQDGDSELCVICRLDYEEGDRLTVLSCEHSYHFDCINSWLQINKVCPVCSAEVSSSING